MSVFDRALKEVGIEEGFRDDTLYEFWPSEWWPSDGTVRKFRIREASTLIWIVLVNGEVTDGGHFNR